MWAEKKSCSVARKLIQKTDNTYRVRLNNSKEDRFLAASIKRKKKVKSSKESYFYPLLITSFSFQWRKLQ